jgi:hypothetical protein
MQSVGQIAAFHEAFTIKGGQRYERFKLAGEFEPKRDLAPGVPGVLRGDGRDTGAGEFACSSYRPCPTVPWEATLGVA